MRRLADAEQNDIPSEGWSPETGDHRKKASLHKYRDIIDCLQCYICRFMERQMSSVVSQLHDEVMDFWQECCEEHQKRKGVRTVCIIIKD